MNTELDLTLQEFTNQRNSEKLLFSAGPASLLPENLSGLRSCFGRGDDDYLQIETGVLEHLKKISGHERIARLQGSATAALEIMTLNFLFGRVLVIDTGYYGQRMLQLARSAMMLSSEIRNVDVINWESMDQCSGSYDWILACKTETSCGLLLPNAPLHSLAKRSGARIMLDATASIGLENDHDIADAIAYSSCKGLFGLTGAAFIAFNVSPVFVPTSFYLALDTHLEKKVTGPYHAIASLANVLPKHAIFRSTVEENKRRFKNQMQAWLQYSDDLQPLLCTHVSCRVNSKDPRAVLYTPRGIQSGSTVCHLGEAHLGQLAKGNILDHLDILAIENE